MSYQQETQDWAYSGEAYRHRNASHEQREAHYGARINGGMRLGESALDGLQALHGIVVMKVQQTPTLAYAGHRILSSVEAACDELILRYMLG
jgi:hypothetical protein